MCYKTWTMKNYSLNMRTSVLLSTIVTSLTYRYQPHCVTLISSPQPPFPCWKSFYFLGSCHSAISSAVSKMVSPRTPILPHPFARFTILTTLIFADSDSLTRTAFLIIEDTITNILLNPQVQQFSFWEIPPPQQTVFFSLMLP